MQKSKAQREAVRLAKEKLGEVTSEELATYIQEAFGLTIRPPIVTVLLGAFQEREALDQVNRAVRRRMEVWKAENPEDARKLTATAKRKESARQRKAKAAGEKDQPTPATEVSAFSGDKRVVADPVLSSESAGASASLPGLVSLSPSDYTVTE